MNIYYVMIEAIPHRSNPERKEFGGAFVNCWVKANTPADALANAKQYIKDENWVFVKTEEIRVASMDSYVDEPELLECYEEACETSFSAIFYTWPV